MPFISDGIALKPAAMDPATGMSNRHTSDLEQGTCRMNGACTEKAIASKPAPHFQVFTYQPDLPSIHREAGARRLGNQKAEPVNRVQVHWEVAGHQRGHWEAGAPGLSNPTTDALQRG